MSLNKKHQEYDAKAFRLYAADVLPCPCVKCGAFDRNKRGGCKACTNAYMAAYRVANLDKAKASDAKYRAANVVKVKAKNAAYRVINAQKARAVSAAWRAAYPEKAKTLAAVWRTVNAAKEKSRKAARYAANATEEKIKKAARYAANPDAARATASAWAKANPAARRIHKQNRRARKADNGGVLTKNLSEKLFTLQKGKCACCKQPLGTKYQLDHIMPLALGGPNTDDNIQLLHQRCNGQKHAKHPIEFMQSRGFLL